MMKRVLAIGVALLVALGAGWVWGASGRSDLTRALRIAELRDGLLEGRAAVLDARLDTRDEAEADSEHFDGKTTE
jgi:hypothetical protein